MSSACSLLILLSALSQEAANTPDLRCGSYCLYVSLKALDLPAGSFEELEEKLGQPTAGAGYSLAQLEEAARQYGAKTLGVETSFTNLRRRPGRFACIAHLDGNHFVNIADVDQQQARIIDPPKDYAIPLDTLQARWDGKALLIGREPLLAEEDLPRPLPLAWLIGAGVAVAVLFVTFLILKKRSPHSA